MIAVILLRSLFAMRFLRTMDLIDFFSKNKRTWVRVTSMMRCSFRATMVRPKMMPKRMKRKILEIIWTLNESKARGRI